ncbi:hypothetical protein H8356DRAFT_1358527 [Neocallimastix lanati (nom. inval.)]|nr:hypothetical protein H8356DRAFT_1358527 [Neocallimastix sp. JGI-2020a]
MWPLFSPLNVLVPDSYWIICYIVSTHSLYAALYNELLFRRNSYTNPLTDQGKTPWEDENNPHMNSGGSRGNDNNNDNNKK